MHWDTLLDGTQVDVRVRDGMVFLSGTVGSAAEVRRAELDAMVGGVEAVDSSGLVVAKWARDEQMRNQKYLPRSDFAIRAAVLDALSYDPRLATFDIDAKVTAGKVVLKGVVDNIQARRAAQQDARNTVGVVWVENLIKIRPVAQLDTASIAENVRGELQRNPFTENHDIEVSVRNGVVYLDGSVETSFEKAIAENIAFRARGVTRVRNNLVVGYPENIGYNPYVYQWSIHDYPWYDTTTLTLDSNDKQIAREIRDELFWSPFVDSDDVAVSVEDGVATLTGTVGSLGEYRAARENAYEGGALRVRNRIQVE
jgi:osmotically-inducible protein OsmY